MILLVAFVVLVALVPVMGGRLGNLADLEVRKPGLIAVALVVQVLITQADLGLPHVVSAALHLMTYALGVLFLWENRHVPWLWLIGLGGTLNAIAILVNGGVMPASPDALLAAGRLEEARAFANSAAVADPRLSFLGDIFAIPARFPLANVFSIGDVVLLLGGVLLVHAAAGSWLPWARFRGGSERGGRLSLLRNNRDFRLLWLAGAASDIGDWTYSLAVITILAGRGASAGTFAALFAVQMTTSALVGALGTQLVDRSNRMRLLAITNIVQALATASLLLPGEPTVAHFMCVGALLGGLSVLVRPATMASIPNLVDEDQLVTANGFVATAFNVAVTLGPALGAAVVSRWGARPAIILNVGSFALSALWVARITRRDRPEPASVDDEVEIDDDAGWLPNATAGVRHIYRLPVLRGLILMMALVIFGAAVRAPVEPLFILRVLDAGPGGIGLLAGVWGLGMVVGSSVAVALGNRIRRERLLLSSVGVLGACVLVASQAGTVGTVAVLWLLAGSGNALGSVAYESLLQERTPDRIRGRVFGATNTLLEGAYLLGALAAGVLSSTFGLRAAMAVAGGVVVAAALLGLRLVFRRSETAAQPVHVDDAAADAATTDDAAFEARVVAVDLPALESALAPESAGEGARGVAPSSGGPVLPERAYDHWGEPIEVTPELAVSPGLDLPLLRLAADVATTYGWLRVVGDHLPAFMGGGLACRLPNGEGAVIVLDPVAIERAGATVGEVFAHELAHLVEWSVAAPAGNGAAMSAAAGHGERCVADHLADLLLDREPSRLSEAQALVELWATARPDATG